MKSFISILLAFFLVAAAAFSAPAPSFPWDQEAQLLMHISYLASDLRDGRGINTPGLDSSAAYIAHRFRDAGLQPLFGESFDQPFTMNWGAEALPGTRIATSDSETVIELGEFCTPLGFSASASTDAEAIFAGYGISAPEYDYDDYANIDTRGKIVVILDGEPAMESEDSKFSGVYNTDHSILRTKAINARMHGAAGLVLVNPIMKYNDEDVLPSLRADEPYSDAGIPVLMLRREAAAELFPALKLEMHQTAIDKSEAPASESLGSTVYSMTVSLERNDVPVKNVGAMLPGNETVIVIGAHYDHLGYGQMGSTEPDVREVHNGADDNGSGVAVLLELADHFASNPPGPTLWFVAFTAEEVGLVGSNHFVNNPPESLDNVKFMLNMDMFGRIENHKLTVHGIGSAKGLPDAATSAAEGTGLEISMTGDGYGASDQTSFYVKGIPVSHLLGTLHGDYHSTRDDIAEINSIDLVRALRFARNYVIEIGKPSTTLVYQEKAKPDEKSSGRRGLAVSMGTIPDFSQPDSLKGFRIQGVRSGSPADKAGLTGMDVLLSIDGQELTNIYDFMFVLKRHKPGDVVEVIYSREGETHTTSVELAASKRRGGGSGRHPGKGKPETHKQ